MKDSTIFKFYRYSDFVKHVLLKQELWFSKHSDFNDPFEFQLAPPLNLSDEEILEYYHLMKKLGGTKIDTIIENNPNAFIWSYRYSPDMFNQTYLAPFEKRLSQFGICCFSEISDNILMWSHYSDCHKGIVIEFDKLLLDQSLYDLNPDSVMSVIDKVNYSKVFPLVKMDSDLKKTADSIKAVSFTKSLDWAYEKEVRIVTSKIGNNKFDIKAIISITFGCKIKKENIKELKEILNKIDPKNKIQSYYMKIDKRNYRLERKIDY